MYQNNMFLETISETCLMISDFVWAMHFLTGIKVIVILLRESFSEGHAENIKYGWFTKLLFVNFCLIYSFGISKQLNVFTLSSHQ